MSNYTVKIKNPPVFSSEIIEKAFDGPRCGYKTINCHNELAGSGSLLYLLLCEKYHPGFKSINGDKGIDKIMSHFRYLLLPGSEPTMGSGPYWGYPVTSAAITLAKTIPSVWNQLTPREIEKLDAYMWLFSIGCAWGTNDCNDFWTGPDLIGNFKKGWNPNHRSPGVLPIMFASIYFGSAEKVNDMLVNFSYDEALAICDRLDMPNAKKVFQTAGKELFENGGECYLLKDNEYANKGAGVKHPYVYRGIPLTDTEALFNEILLQNTKGGVVVDIVGDKESGVCGYVMEGSSPVLGLDGMMTEFVSHDAKGIRSDVIYCSSNFCILSPAMAAMVALGAWDPADPKNAEASEKTAISIIDFMYKIEKGYFSYCHGHGTPKNEKNAHGVYPFAKDFWLGMLS